MKSFIKVVNPEVAKRLETEGFSYVTESVNGTVVFVFVVSPDLMSALCACYGANDYFVDNKLRF